MAKINGAKYFKPEKKNKKRNSDVRKTTNVIDALKHCKKVKWKWAGHIARMSEENWIKRVITWTGLFGKRNKTRPIERWIDEIEKAAVKDWMTKAADKNTWRNMEEAFTQWELNIFNDLSRQRCPCCKTCKDCPAFQKVVNVKNAGLVIYRYATCMQEVDNHHERPGEIFIIHNTKNVDINPEKVIPEFGQYKKCPRCKYILENVEKILHKVPTIKKLDVIGICDKCRTKGSKGILCCDCSGVVKKFITIQSYKKSLQPHATEGIQRQYEMQQLLNRVITKDKQLKKSNNRRSESFLHNLCPTSYKEKHEPKVAELIESKKELYGSILPQTQPERIRFSKSAQKIRSPRKYYSDTKLISLDSEITHLESKTEIKKQLSDGTINISEHYDPTMDLKLNKKKEIEYQFKRKYRSEESVTFNVCDVSHKASELRSLHLPPEQHEKYLHSTILQKTHPVNKQSEDLLDKSKKSFISKLISERHRHKKHRAKKESLDFDSKIRAGTLRESISVMSDIGTGIFTGIRDLTTPSQSTSRKHRSEEALPSSVLSGSQELLHKDFSYFFIREAELMKKPISNHKSSSELIKDTQDMLRAREEEFKKKNEEQLKRKLEEEEKKRLAREEKVILVRERKRILEEEKEKKAIEENKKILQKEKEKNAQQSDVSSKTTSIKEKMSKGTRTLLEKNKKSATLVQSDEDKKSEAELKKAHKAKERQEKEEKVRLEKERTLKEKEEKAKLKKEKEEQQRKAKEEKDKLKKEKEELLRKDKEDKEKILRKQKEEKEELLRKEKETLKQQKQDGRKENQKQPKDTAERRKEKDKNQVSKREIQNGRDMQSENKKEKEEAELKLKSFKETEIKTEPEKPILEKKSQEPKTKELSINQIRIRKPSTDDLILQLVKLKQSEVHQPRVRAKRLSEVNIPLTVITEHQDEHKGQKIPTCIICNDSELELDIEDIILKKNKSPEVADIILGQQIFKYKPPLIEKIEEKQTIPILFTSIFNDDLVTAPETKELENIPDQLKCKQPQPLPGKYTEQEIPKGVIRYALSDRAFIDKGWTMLPTEKVVRKMNVYRMRPAHPEFDWFEHNKNKKIIHYDSGEKLAEFDNKGRGRWYYRSGRLALDYYDAEEVNAQQRFVIHSSGEPDERGRSRPLVILATFDYLGNGIVFDHTGKIRLKYNQTEGVVLDRSIGPVSHWKWHTLNDPPVLQQVMIDTQMAHKDPDILKLGGPADNKTRPDNEEMLAIEFDNFIKEKSKKLSQKFKPFQIKMKALKINEHFSLKILDQATVYLIFRDGTTNLKLNIGMILDHQEIVDTDTAEVGEVSNSLERFPARTDSLAGLQRSVAFAQRVERAQVERERRLRPTQPCSSSDKLISAASRPLRNILRTAPSTVATCDCQCRYRKPPSNNIYYDTRLV